MFVRADWPAIVSAHTPNSDAANWLSMKQSLAQRVNQVHCVIFQNHQHVFTLSQHTYKYAFIHWKDFINCLKLATPQLILLNMFCKRHWAATWNFTTGCYQILHIVPFNLYLENTLTSPQIPTVSWRLCLWYDSCLMQLLTAMLLLPGAMSSSDISTQPSERTAKHCKCKDAAC